MPVSAETFFLGIGIALALLFFMRTRRFYFIRHGETLLNAAHIRQGADGALSDKGRQQADAVGNYLKQYQINRIITSSYPRAEETAKILQTHLRVPVRLSSLYIERRNPSEIIGKKTDDPDVIRIVDHMDLAFHADDYRFSDEENFLDLRRRAHRCLRSLAYNPTQQTVVVTHHVLLKMLVASMLYPNNLHAADFVKLSFFNVSDNAGITICEFNPWKLLTRTHGWRVISFNEQPT